jgi:two-component system response regulator FlrC
MPEILTTDAVLQRVLREASAAAATDTTVLIVGESGTGKDLLARHLHDHSARRLGPFVAVSCAALPESLAECELFGHERGAFTGAGEARTGQIAAAEGGTLLLDEVAAMEPWLQPKLLRVIQEREVLPVGGLRPRPVDLRIVATTQRELGPEVAAGRFREDLYYRLDVIVLRIPPLRERIGDLPLLAGAFLSRFAEAAGAEAPRLPAEALHRLAKHPFRGNVRELENLMRRAVFMFPGREIDAELLLRPASAAGASRAAHTLNLKELERQAITRSLQESEGNRTRAARVLGISVRTLRNKIRLYGLA